MSMNNRRSLLMDISCVDTEHLVWLKVNIFLQKSAHKKAALKKRPVIIGFRSFTP